MSEETIQNSSDKSNIIIIVLMLAMAIAETIILVKNNEASSSCGLSGWVSLLLCCIVIYILTFAYLFDNGSKNSLIRFLNFVLGGAVIWVATELFTSHGKCYKEHYHELYTMMKVEFILFMIACGIFFVVMTRIILKYLCCYEKDTSSSIV
jgi:low temperature requirement protein LtrA